MLHFATYFDKNYLSRGLVLYNSLKENCPAFYLYLLCMDEATFNYFNERAESYPNVKLILLSELEKNDPELLAAKDNRKLIEYYFTLSPCLPLYLIKKYQIPHICTLDADMLFLSDPTPLFNELENHSIIITPHKFSKELIANEKFGIYNVSFQIFKNDVYGLQCLNKWRTQCIEWCGDSFDELNQRYADQKYLDDWTTLYPEKVKALNDDVSGLATWNLNNYSISKQGRNYFSNGKKIIFYHFHHCKFYNSHILFNGFYNYKVRASKYTNELYSLYWAKIDAESGHIKNGLQASTRHYNSNKLASNIYYEKTLYFRLPVGKLLPLNFNWLSSFLNKLMKKNA